VDPGLVEVPHRRTSEQRVVVGRVGTINQTSHSVGVAEQAGNSPSGPRLVKVCERPAADHHVETTPLGMGGGYAIDAAATRSITGKSPGRNPIFAR
jgi:hypothetical protein